MQNSVYVTMNTKGTLVTIWLLALGHCGYSSDIVFEDDIKETQKNNNGVHTNSEFIKREGFAPIVYPGQFEAKKNLAKQESFGFLPDIPDDVKSDGMSLDTRMDPNV